MARPDLAATILPVSGIDIPTHHFHLYLKECEWRFNYRPTVNLLKVLMRWAKM
jgi:transposase-like protein